MSKYLDVIRKAREPRGPRAQAPAPPEPLAPSPAEEAPAEVLKPEKEEEVNLSIKVPRRLRRHWVAEAKRRDTTLTAVIQAALKEQLGEPPDDES